MKRPKLCAMAMDAVASFSHLDTFFVEMYMNLVGGPLSVAANLIYAAQTTVEKNRYRSVIRKTIDDKDRLVVFDSLIKKVATAEKERNKLCHWIWGYSDDIEDGILLADPRAHPPTNEAFPLDKVYVYFEQDFRKQMEFNEQLAGIGRIFGDVRLWDALKHDF